MLPSTQLTRADILNIKWKNKISTDHNTGDSIKRTVVNWYQVTKTDI